MDIVSTATVIGTAIAAVGLAIGVLQLRQGSRKAEKDERGRASPEPRTGSSGTNTQYGPISYWGTAPSEDFFLGREVELHRLSASILDAHRNVVVITGPAGVGKSQLAIELASKVMEKTSRYDVMVWRSLKDGLGAEALVTELISLMSRGRRGGEGELGTDIPILAELLHKSRLLLILDNVESILEPQVYAGMYAERFKGYASLMQLFTSGRTNSALLLTGREVPLDATPRGGIPKSRVDIVRLEGLGLKDGVNLLRLLGARGSDHCFEHLCQLVVSNPLQLRIVAGIAREIFAGSIDEYCYTSSASSGDLGTLMGQQVARASDLEQEILYWLAVERVPVTIEILRGNILAATDRQELVAGVDSLFRRNLCERTREGRFMLQPAVAEHLTSDLVRRITTEVETLQPNLFNRVALLTSHAPEYAKLAQRAYLLQSIVNLLVASRGSVGLHATFDSMHRHYVHHYKGRPTYGVGNLINIAGAAHISLEAHSFNDLEVRHADFSAVKVSGASFSGARFVNCEFHRALGSLHAISATRDGALLATGGSTGDIWILQRYNLRERTVYRGHWDWIRDLSFHPDLPILASASDDTTVLIWNYSNDTEIARCKGHKGKVTGLAFDLFEKHLVSVGEEGYIIWWSTEDWSIVRRVVVSGDALWSVAISSRTRTIAVGGEDSLIRLWSLDTYQQLGNLAGHDDAVLSVAFDETGHRLVSGGRDGTIRVWDLVTETPVRVYREHGPWVWSVSITADGRAVAGGFEDGAIKVWALSDTAAIEQHTLVGHTKRVWAVKFLPGDEQLASASAGQSLRVWDLHTGQCSKAVSGSMAQLSALDAYMHEDEENIGLVVIMGGEDQLVRTWTWDGRQAVQQAVLAGHKGRVWSLRVLSPGELLSAGEDRTVRLWKQKGSAWSVHTLAEMPRQVWCMELVDDRRIVALAVEGDSIYLLDRQSGNLLGELSGHEAWVWSVASWKNSAYLASASYDGTVGWWDVRKQRLLRRWSVGAAAISVVPDDDSGHLIVGDYDGNIGVWDPDKGARVAQLSAHTGPVWSVAVSASNGVIASGGADCSVGVWDLSTGVLRTRLLGHEDVLNRIFFTSNGLLVSGAVDGTIRIWQPCDWRCIAVIRAPRPYENMDLRGALGLNDREILNLSRLGALVAD